ncbi:MAG TPA: TAXI family TRAP transporter solute-binding subunit [Kiritimatiellia bacterium]|nr:TAXI family TRAP transporter solute-binding subunit [Kiritimatiellia bacterium]
MNKYLRYFVGLILLASSVAVISCSERQKYFTMGTGGVTGVYYPTGGAIAKLINDKRSEYGIRISVESTGGSVYNINALASGDLDFGIAQSDLQYQALNGLGEWVGTPQIGLRFVMGMHPEIITLVAADDADIRSLTDLKGKRVNVGNPGSGNRANAIDILTAAGIDWESELTVESLRASEAPRMVQDGRMDAFFYTVGHPNGAISEATSGRRKVRFVPITGLDSYVESHPYYSMVEVPVDLYPMAVVDGPVSSIGVITTLVTHEKVSDDVVYAVVKEVYENFSTYRELHPALERLKPSDLLRGRSAPFHPGAEKFYREVGLISE